MKKLNGVWLALIFIFTIFETGCAKKIKGDTSSNDVVMRKIHHIIPYNVHFRRPPYLGSDPAVTAGGEDYKTNPLPSEKFDCQPIPELFKGLKKMEMRSCFLTLLKRVDVQLQLVRKAAPYYELVEDEFTPECIKKVLKTIPLPRELFFQTNEEGFMSCYGTRLNIEADEFMYVKMPRAKVVLKLRFPLDPNPQTDEELERLMFSWITTPFWEEPGHFLNAKVVPSVLCKACMGEKNLYDESGPIVLWP